MCVGGFVRRHSAKIRTLVLIMSLLFGNDAFSILRITEAV